MSKVKVIKKKITGKPLQKTDKLDVKPPNGIELLKIESGIPVPDRTLRDPEFYNSVLNILKTIKPKQSFVLRKSKVHFTLNLAKKEFGNYKMKSSLILPDRNFSRIWRLA